MSNDKERIEKAVLKVFVDDIAVITRCTDLVLAERELADRQLQEKEEQIKALKEAMIQGNRFADSIKWDEGENPPMTVNEKTIADLREEVEKWRLRFQVMNDLQEGFK